MDNNPQVFHGEWWVPAVADHDTRMNFLQPEGMMGHERKYTGTLTYYGDKDSTLELYHTPSSFHSKHYSQNDVIWGKDANGNIFTLFNVMMNEQRLSDFSSAKFVVAYILIGEHVLSAFDKCFGGCVVQFQYLRNWAFHDNISKSNAGKSILFKTPIYAEKLLEATIEDGYCWRLWQGQVINRDIYDLKIVQTTTFEIEALEAISIRSCMRQIVEFAQFLSIALYGDQNPSEIKFVNKENKHECIFLFKMDASVDPGVMSLIKFGIFKEKLPKMLNTWHENFEKMAPISSYLIESLQKKNRFDVPDFLIIAQALDGYHKRFVNKKDGKDIQKYKDQIEILLNQFKDVKAIVKCQIKPEVLTDSRNYYSHLFPDEEIKSAVEGDDLYWLTEKCKILLTCCILNLLGLTNKEINLCCENSPINQMMDSFPLEQDPESMLL